MTYIYNVYTIYVFVECVYKEQVSECMQKWAVKSMSAKVLGVKQNASLYCHYARRTSHLVVFNTANLSNDHRKLTVGVSLHRYLN